MGLTKITAQEVLSGTVANNPANRLKKITAQEVFSPKDKNKNSSLLGDMWSGHASNINRYLASIQKGIGKGFDKVGFEKAGNYMKEASDYSSYLANKEQDKINSNLGAFAGEVIGDPLNLFGGLGVVNKANKLRKANNLVKAKEISKGAGTLGAFSAGSSVLRDYGDDSVSSDQMKQNALLSGAIGSVLGGGIVSGVPQEMVKKGYGKVKGGINKLRSNTGNPIIDNVLESANPNLTPRELNRVDKKEMARVHQVLEDEKPSTIIRKYNDSNKDAIIFEKGNTKYGARHIQRRHLGEGKKGEVSKYDIMSMGQGARDYMKKNLAPAINIDDKGNIKNAYEWTKNNDRFRISSRNLNEAELVLPQANFNQPREKIISFYSDKNLKEPMDFHTKAYQNSEKIPQNSKFSFDRLNGAITNQAGSAVSGAGVGGLIGTEYDSKGNINWNSTLAGMGAGALAGLGIKNSPKIVKNLETRGLQKDLEKTNSEYNDFLAISNPKKETLLKSLDEVNSKVEIPDEILRKNDAIDNLLNQYQESKKATNSKNIFSQEIRGLQKYKEKINRPYNEQIELEKAKINRELKPINDEELLYKSKIKRLEHALKDDTDFKNLNGVVGKLRGYFSNTFSDDFNRLRDRTTSNLSKTTQDIENIGKLFNGYEKEHLQKMGRALQGDSSAVLDKKDADIVNTFRNMIDNNTKELKELGFFDEDTLNEFLGNYTIRNYDLSFKDKMKNITKTNFGLGDLTKTRGDESAISMAKFKELLRNDEISRYGDGDFSKGKYTYFTDENGNPILNKDGKLIVRKDKSQKDRIALGEDTDISIIGARTLLKQRELIEHAKYLKAIDEMGKELAKNGGHKQQIFFDMDEVKHLNNKDQIARASGFEKLGDSFGVLSGKYVRKDIANDLKASYDKIHGTFFNSENSLGVAYKNLLNMWKKSKTVYNSKAHINNLVSNATLMHLNGFNPADLPKQAGVIRNAREFKLLKTKEAFNTISQKEKAELLKMSHKMRYYEEAYNAGLFGRGQIADVSSGKSQMKNIVGSVARKAEDLYQAEDNIARLSVFTQLRKRGHSIDEAKALTNKFIPDYSTYMPPAIRFLRDTGIAPFISWSYYVLPNMIKTLGTGAGSARFVTALGVFYAMEKIADKMYNFDDGAIPKNQRGKYLNIYRDGDTVTRLKIDRMVPYLELARNPLSPMQVMQSPILQGLFDLAQIANGRHLRQVWNDMPVTQKNKSKPEQVYDYTKYAINQYTPVPAQLMSGWSFIESLVRDNKKRKTNAVYVPRSTPQEVLNFIGINTSNYSQKASKKAKRREEERMGGKK